MNNITQPRFSMMKKFIKSLLYPEVLGLLGLIFIEASGWLGFHYDGSIMMLIIIASVLLIKIPYMREKHRSKNMIKEAQPVISATVPANVAARQNSTLRDEFMFLEDRHKK